MSQAFDHILQDLDRISEQEKYALRELLEHGLETPSGNGTAANKPSAFGWAKDRITISSDFDAPLEDFKEYIE